MLTGLVLLIRPQAVAWLAFPLMGAMAQLVAIGSLLPLLQMHWQNPYRTAVRIYGIFALTKAVAMVFLAARFRKAGDRLGMRMVNR